MKRIILYILIAFSFFNSVSFSQIQPLSWVKANGSYWNEYGKDIKVDTSGNVIVTGTFQSLVDFDPGIGTYTMQPAFTGNTSIYIQKLDRYGNFILAKQISGPTGTSTITPNSVYMDDLGFLYITGNFKGIIDFDPGPSSFTLNATNQNAFVCKLDNSGNFAWARSFTCTSICNGNSVHKDPSGNIFVCGSYSGTADFDPAISTYTSVSIGGEDIYVVKLDPSGNFVWAKTAGGGNMDVANSVRCDLFGNSIITGYFNTIVDFDPGPATNYVSSAGAEDAFIQKLDPLGNLIWITRIGSSWTEKSIYSTIDKSNNIYFTGIYESPSFSPTDFDPGPSTYTLGSKSLDIFVEKIDQSGNFIWARGFGGRWSSEVSTCLALDSSNNVYTTGVFQDTTDFDPGPGTYTLTSALTSMDIFLHKMDVNGNFIWVNPISGTNNESCNSIYIDNKQNLHGTGYFQDVVDFDPGPATYTMASLASTPDAFAFRLGCPNIAPVITTPTANLIVCSGTSASLTASGAYNIGWYSSSTGGTLFGTGNTFISSPLFSNITFYVQDSLAPTCFSNRTPITVTVISSPTIIVSPSSNPVCSGQSSTITASGANTYTWNPGNLNGSSIVVTPTATTNYSVVGTTSYTCQDSKTVSIGVVNCFPSLNFILSNTVCVSSSVSITANTGTTTATGYTWTALPSGAVISAPNASSTPITFNAAGTYTISLFATDGYTTVSVSKTITAGPNLTSSGPTWPICPPPTAQGMLWCIANGASSYTWMPGNVANDTLLLSPYPSVSTTYTVIGTDANGCTTYTTQYVQVRPQVNIVVSAPSVACDGSTVCFNEIGGDLVLWVWNDGCGNSSSSGSYACFTASLSCGNTFTVGGNNTYCMNYISFSVNVSACTDVNQIEVSDNSYSVYPNPIIDKINLKNNSLGRNDIEMEIIDVSGRMIYRSKCFKSEGVYSIDVSELSPGIYFARIISKDQISKPVKIVKE